MRRQRRRPLHRGADGIYAKDGSKLSLRISTAGNQQVLRRVAASRQLRHRQLRLGRQPLAISSSQDIYRTGGGGNYGAYASKKVDQLFAQAVRETDEARSAELGNQIDQQLTADMATIPLYAKPTCLAVRNTFANIGDNATQEGPFWNSDLWAQKAT